MSLESANKILAEEKNNQTGKLNLSLEKLRKIPDELLELKDLKILYLNYNHIVDISFFKNLTKLQSLYLRNNQITDIRYLENLTDLQNLYLRSNQILDISFLKKLNNLENLDLSDNQIVDVSFLKKLTNLVSLDLSDNQILDISFLEKLTKLESLDLSGNQIEDISFLEKLINLKSLYLSRSQIADYSFLEKLNNLESLDLSDNLIPDYSFLKKLTKLESIDLSGNQILDISFLEKLTNLQSVDLSNNKINKLPRWMLDFKLAILYKKGYGDRIYIGNNPLQSPPIEIVKKGNREIAKYFNDLKKQGKDYLYEAKLIIVGDGGAGKTSLAWKMKGLDSSMPKEGEDRTKGIDIQSLPITNILKPELPFLMNVWDFGGQGYYHSTHQFFLTKRSLYVLLNNTRINKTDFNDWLQTISLFSDNSPVILVENEMGGAKSELDLRGLQQFFDNILYLRIADISNATDGRLEKLINDIQLEIQRLPHIGSELPSQWVKIRKSLKDKANFKTFITDKEFHQICREHNIIDNDAIKRLGGLFHDLGIFLHFREDKVLKRIVFLKNAWVTKGVYSILDSELVRSQNGSFTIYQAESIWKNTPYEDMYDELVSLMEKFRLCYRIPYSSPAGFISPNLLPVEKPNFKWDNHQNLIIYYDYDFMPKGILGMLIVELHRYVKDIKKMAWRNGCIFYHQNTDALVTETYGKKRLEIRIFGAHCVHLSSIIISEIDKLNTSFKRIKVKKLIPCPCKICIKSDVSQFYNYEDLMRRKANNRRSIECSKSYELVEVLEILEASFKESYTEKPNLRRLISKGLIKESIDVFEQEFPDEGTLLLSRFNQLERYYYLGLISTEDWQVNRQRIADSVLKMTETGSIVRLSKHKKEVLELNQLDLKLNEINSQIKGQIILFNKIIDRSNIDQHELLALLRTIESKDKVLSKYFSEEIIKVVKRGMSDFSHKVPNAINIIEDWKRTNDELKLEKDYSVKLKWVIPFLFLRLEKEMAWDGKDWFNAIKEDIKRGVKGNWSEMFISE